MQSGGACYLYALSLQRQSRFSLSFRPSRVNLEQTRPPGLSGLFLRGRAPLRCDLLLSIDWAQSLTLRRVRARHREVGTVSRTIARTSLH